MTARTLSRSFSSGEITPELFGRVDLTKFQTGLKTCRNFEILPHGPATNRAGFEYVLETKYSDKKSILLPFIYNSTQTYQLEFGDQYVRFHSGNGTVLETPQAITSATNANPGVFGKTAHGYANGDWLFWSDVAGMSGLANRFLIVAAATANTFQLTDLAGTAFNTTGLGVFTTGLVARVYELATPYLHTDLFDSAGAVWLHITQSADVMTLVHPSYQSRELKRLAAASWTLTPIVVTPSQQPPTAGVATPTLSGGVAYTYAVTALAANTLEESVQTTDITCSNDLTIAGHTNQVTWSNVTGAIRYNVYKKISGLYGYIGQSGTGAEGLIDNNITPTLLVTPPVANDPISAVDAYPSAVGYFDGRRWFAGSNSKPQGLYATRSGTESNMGYSVPTQANDAISVRLISRQADVIRHIVPLADLVLLTSGGEWKVSNSAGGALAGGITPLDISYRPEDYIGASNAAPVVTASAVLYAQDRGGRVREMKFDWRQQGYRCADVSIMAPHLFDNYSLKQMAYTRGPYSIVWAPRSDGNLLGLTYVQEHDVSAWHHHDTAGAFESVCVTPEGPEDILYAIVNRTINGRQVRYVERKRSRNFGTLPFAFFVDAGSTYKGAATTIVSGLYHLEGATVSILADGGVQPQQTVANGAITLPFAASVVNVGLPYTSDFETLPLAIESEMASAQGILKNVNKVYLRVNNSSGIRVGPTLAKLTPYKQRTTEVYGAAPNPVSGVIDMTLTPGWNPNGGIALRQTDPLPVTVLALVLEEAQGG
jgi:hypothetical protein